MSALSAGQRDTIARLSLQQVFEPADERVGRLVAERGAARVVESLSTGSLTSELRPHQQRWRGSHSTQAATAELACLYQQDMQITTPLFANWPDGLNDLDDRVPLALRIRGDATALTNDRQRVAIVGARSATRYGVWVAEELGAQLANEGCCVVSGGAFGIDAAAHRGALSNGGVVALVTAAGPDIAAPAAHDGLYADVAAHGCIISEVPLGTHPSRHRFLIRNRIIAALAHVIVVVEAADRSGALATVRDGDAIGRVIAAVPGPITSLMSNGTNALIRSRTAALVRNADDVLECLGWVAN